MSAEILKRLRSMDGAELKFRATAAIRNRVGRARSAITPPTWRRESLTLSDLPALADARSALARREWLPAHRALAEHFVARRPRFVLDPGGLPALAQHVIRRFPSNDAAERADRVLAGKYDLLGYRGVAAGSPPNWHMDPVHGRSAPLLYWDAVPYLDPACGDHKITWELNRHQYFLTLGRAFVLTGDRRYYHAFVEHLEHWIRNNPPLQGTNWASMLELAFRTLSWIWALHFFAPAAGDEDREPWVVDLLLALDRQLDHVEQNLSRYFSPNTHLTGEALALYVAGRVLPEIASSGRFERVGRTVLLEEAQRQVLPDGGHAERSAHYHRYSTDFYLLATSIARITEDPAAAPLRDSAHRQAIYLRAIANDNGELPLIGDDDGGQLFAFGATPASNASATLASASVLLDDPALAVADVPEATLWMCGTAHAVPEALEHREVPSVGFTQSGYYVCRDRDMNHLVFDCGPHGFLNGGHAHSDALSIVASVRGTPLLVDPGTATYTTDPVLRDRFRSTAMHNTVVCDGRSQSEPRGPFHWSTRTDAHCQVWQPGDPVDYVEGYHDGYAPVRHVRCVFAVRRIGWIVIDHLVGPSASIHADVMWHIDPRWSWARTSERAATLKASDGREASLAMSIPLRVVREKGLDAFAPEYGRLTEALCLAGEFEGHLPVCFATFIATRAEWRANSVTPLHVDMQPGESRGVFHIDGPAGSLIVCSSTADQDTEWDIGTFRKLARAGLLRLTRAGTVELCSVRRRTLASSVQRS